LPVLVFYGARARAGARASTGLHWYASGALPERLTPEDDAALAPWFAKLAERAVVIWPETDDGGLARAHRHAQLFARAGATAVGVVSHAPDITKPLPANMPKFAFRDRADAALAAAKALALPALAGRGVRAVAPWPERTDLARLFADTCAFLSRHLAEPRPAIETIALWSLHAWGARAETKLFDLSPRLILRAVDPRADHARALRLIAWLTPAPLLVSRAVAAHLLPVIHDERPTVLIDDVTGGTLYRRDMRTLIAAGAHRDGMFLTRRSKSIESGRGFCFAPTAIATASVLPEDVRALAVAVPMTPAPPGDPRPRINLIDPPDEVLALRAHMQAAIGALLKDRPSAAAAPSTLGPRAAENWHPLLTLAQCIGADVAARAAEAAVQFSASAPPPASNLALLRDVRDLCAVGGQSRITSHDMLEKLVADPDRPWATVFRGRPLNPRTLAERFATFGLRPRVVRKPDGVYARGYYGEELVDAFARYLSDTAPEEVCDASQTTPK
jgi:hypothetical protein